MLFRERIYDGASTSLWIRKLHFIKIYARILNVGNMFELLRIGEY